MRYRGLRAFAFSSPWRAAIVCRELLDAPVFGISEISLNMVMQSNPRFAILTPFFHPDYSILLNQKLSTFDCPKNCTEIIEIDTTNKSFTEIEMALEQAATKILQLNIKSVVLYSGYLLQYKMILENALISQEITFIEPLKVSLNHMVKLLNHQQFQYHKEHTAPDKAKIAAWLAK